MANQNSVIREILLETGVYGFALAQCESEDELFRMFDKDFEGLISLCQKKKTPGSGKLAGVQVG